MKWRLCPHCFKTAFKESSFLHKSVTFNEGVNPCSKNIVGGKYSKKKSSIKLVLEVTYSCSGKLSLRRLPGLGRYISEAVKTSGSQMHLEFSPSSKCNPRLFPCSAPPLPLRRIQTRDSRGRHLLISSLKNKFSHCGHKHTQLWNQNYLFPAATLRSPGSLSLLLYLLQCCWLNHIGWWGFLILKDCHKSYSCD